MSPEADSEQEKKGTEERQGRGGAGGREQPELPPPPCSTAGGGVLGEPQEECGQTKSILSAATPKFPIAQTLHGLQGPRCGAGLDHT